MGTTYVSGCGVRVIRAFDRNQHQSQRFAAANLDLTDNAIAVNRLVSLLMPAMNRAG